MNIFQPIAIALLSASILTILGCGDRTQAQPEDALTRDDETTISRIGGQVGDISPNFSISTTDGTTVVYSTLNTQRTRYFSFSLAHFEVRVVLSYST